MRAGRSAQAQLELTRVHVGENLRAEPLADENDYPARGGEIRGHDEPAHAHDSLRQTRIAPLKFRKLAFDFRLAFGSLLMTAQNPNRQNGHQRARQQVGGDHRKTDGE